MPEHLSFQSGFTDQHNSRVHPINLEHFIPDQQKPSLTLTNSPSQATSTERQDHMQYSKADRQAVYRSPQCKRLFSVPENLALRKQKAIRAVVQRHNLTVSNFPREKLVQILQYLLQQGVFSSYHTAHITFSGLTSVSAVRQEPQAATMPSKPDLYGYIMEDHRAWMRE